MAFQTKAVCIVFIISFLVNVNGYEKTLRKIVRSQSKMVQTPFSENRQSIWKNNSQKQAILFPDFTDMRNVVHKVPRPQLTTILTSKESSRGKQPLKIKDNNELRLTRTIIQNSSIPEIWNGSTIFDATMTKINDSSEEMSQSFSDSLPPAQQYFPHLFDRPMSFGQGNMSKEQSIIIPADPSNIPHNTSQIKNIIASYPNFQPVASVPPQKTNTDQDSHQDLREKADFFIEEMSADRSSIYSYNISDLSQTCTKLTEGKADIDLQETFMSMDIEPNWTPRKHFWNSIFDSRYESLMRSPKWPPLRVILVPRTHVDSIWKRTFEDYHNETVSRILSNVVKKLNFYPNFTFTWNEVSHLSHWWKSAPHRSRVAFRRLLKSGRLEITTGGWVETDEATTNIFGLTHLFIEGHQWLKNHLNYSPKVAWLTNSVTHSPTMAYLLSICDITKLVITNVHFSWEQYLSEYQFSDFVWLQEWDHDRTGSTDLNEKFKQIGSERFPKNSVLTHYLQFNSAGFRACGPNKYVCINEFNFANTDKNLNIHPYNLKEKSELLLEQYSKTGTITPHNVVIAPIGGPFRYESQTEFDYQFSNYQKILEFINVNSAIYKARLDFGTPKDYFNTILQNYPKIQSLKGDFLNFADVISGRPAYWTGYFTSRPLLKILMRRLQSTLRSTEILFTFAMSINAFHGYNTTDLFNLLIKSRENLARLLDRNVVSGTLSANVLRYVNKLIVSTVKDCWFIQETAASLITSKPDHDAPYLQKYVYRDGEFVSVFKTVAAGDQIYIFNSLSNERTEVVELITRNPKLRITDHTKKDVTVQINPIWEYISDHAIKISRRFYKIIFVVTLPPMTLALYKIKETYDTSHNAATIYCSMCVVDTITDHNSLFAFNIEQVVPGDIQLESYRYRLVIDEITGFLKYVNEKETNKEKLVVIDYGSFKSSDRNAGMFLFNPNTTKPLHDILSPYRLGTKSKHMIIIAGLITTELTTIYGRLLQHTLKLFNLINGPLSRAIWLESKVDYDTSPKYRDLEMFMSIQTDIGNGNNPEIYIDNNGFQYTQHTLNLSRRVESNVYPVTSMVFIQDSRSRMSYITDHAQGVTALQEGQLIIMLDRRILYNDGRGTNEGLADSSRTCHHQLLLLENFTDRRRINHFSYENILHMPSSTAMILAKSLNYLIDVFIVDRKQSSLSYFTFLPLIKAPFPCDVSVLNYRMVITKGPSFYRTPNTALMILHKQLASCDIHNDFVCGGDNTFSLDKILRSIRGVYRTNLVGTSEDSPMPVCNQINFPPMELITVKVYF
ncbi:alpha-mannosidase 2-like [Amyelois transitella]|uniref:alpha-mannosidase 2-like n=1 Tax=Amyelois transitella TaxID=680683 RepID=UPI00298FBCB5|nr:alpha-mannosidase 2-like [Amyelois transitella]